MMSNWLFLVLFAVYSCNANSIKMKGTSFGSGNSKTNSVCSEASDRTQRPLKEVTCQSGGLHQSESTCFHGFPYTLPPGVVKLTIKEANLGMLGYKLSNEESAFAKSDQLSTLSLRNLSITGICPGVFSTVIKLRVLDLSYNELHSLDESSLQRLTKLEELDLSHNGITTITRLALKQLGSLKKLDLSYNQLEDFNAVLPQSLLHLKLSNNKLYALSNAFDLPNLVTLDLCHNPLRNFGTQLQMPAVTTLCITDKNMGEDILNNFQAPLVKELTLAAPAVDNRDLTPPFSAQACDSFTQFTSLEKLTLEYYSLVHINFLSRLTSCQEVTLQWVTVTQKLTPNCFANVVTLDLSHSKQLAYEVVTSVEIITSMTLLQTITLQHCDLLSLSWYTYFSHLPNFVSCDISYNDRVCDDTTTICQEAEKGVSSKLKGFDTLQCSNVQVISEPQRAVDLSHYCQTTLAVEPTTKAHPTFRFMPSTPAPLTEEKSYIGLIVGLVLGLLLLFLLIGLTFYFCKVKSAQTSSETQATESDRLVKK